MKLGFHRIVHQPVVFTAVSGRRDEVNKPKVGIVHNTTSAYTRYRPVRLPRVALTERPTVSPAAEVRPRRRVVAATTSTAPVGSVVPMGLAVLMMPSVPRLGAGRGG